MYLLSQSMDASASSSFLLIALAIVGGLLGIATCFAATCSIYLGVKYLKFNRRENCLGLTGKEIARKVLDDNDLNKIKVSATGSLMFGNSYSHFFRKVRLRRFTWKKTSLTSMAVATQKASLAILDKNNDPDMEKRIKLTPFIYFGPLAFVPLVIIGIILDVLFFGDVSGLCTIICTTFGVILYVVAFVMAILVLKTEKKAQKIALDIMLNQLGVDQDEISLCEELYQLYNLEYINNMIIALLELIYRLLQIAYEISKKGD